MKEINDNQQKDNWISGSITTLTMVLIIVLLLVCGLKSQIPPPPPKKTFYVDIEQIAGGGGGGGAETPTPQASKTPSGQNYATQNAQDAPAVHHASKTSYTAPAQPKVDQSAMFKGGKGGKGSGGGSGSGIGNGNGSGLGPGEGSGSGGGVGYGTGGRGLVKQINTTVNEEGQVCVEVHVMADGSVSEARVINTSSYKTTITNREIQRQCVSEARQAKYKPGKEELRVIIFK